VSEKCHQPSQPYAEAAQRDRAAYLRSIDAAGDPTDPFLEEIARRTLDRLSDVKRPFPRVLVLGGAGDAVVRRLLNDRPDVRTIVVTDMSRDMLRFVRSSVAAEAALRAGVRSGGFDASSSTSSTSSAAAADTDAAASAAPWTRVDEVINAKGDVVTIHYVHADEEELPITHGSVDVVISVLGLHWANDLPGAMSQARLALVGLALFTTLLCSQNTV
jgi:NADH dehydrogenase [ubiquinone] 1 alpha subcomplex assembly factor 5